MKIFLTICFILAFVSSVYFFGKLLTWMCWKINPTTFEKEITKNDIANYNIVMFCSIILWSIIFHFKQ